MDHEAGHGDENNSFRGVSEEGKLKSSEEEKRIEVSEPQSEERREIPDSEKEDVKSSISTLDEVNGKITQRLCDQSENYEDKNSLVQGVETTSDAHGEKNQQESQVSDHSGNLLANKSSIQAVGEKSEQIFPGGNLSDEKNQEKTQLENSFDINSSIQDVEIDREHCNVSSEQCIENSPEFGDNQGEFGATSEDEVKLVDADYLKENYIAEGSPVNVEALQEKCAVLNLESNENEREKFSIKEKPEIVEAFLDVAGVVSAETSTYFTENVKEQIKVLQSSILVDTDEEGNANGNIGSKSIKEDDQDACRNIDIADNNQTLNGPNSNSSEKKQEQPKSIITSYETNSDGKEDTLSEINVLEIKQEIVESDLSCDALHQDADSVEATTVMDQVCTTGISNEEPSSEKRAIATIADKHYASPLVASASPVQFDTPMNTERLNLKHIKGKRKQGNKVKMEINPLSPTLTEGSSNAAQHGKNTDKDGGSSLDSTAGSGCKPKGSYDQITIEDANSSGGEDSASSPASGIQISQQRKKINIHHQFVREIVRIQHDREQYDKEQVERQMQAQQSANLVQVESKILENKEHKTNLEGKRHMRIDAQFLQKTLSSQSHETKSKQKHNAEPKKTSSLQTKRGPLQPDEFHEIDRKPSIQGDDALGKRGSRRIDRDKQRSISIYRPPVARESAKGSQEQHNVDVGDSSYHQTATYVNSSSDGSTGSVFESSFPSLELHNLDKAEGGLKVVKSSSGERYVHYVEPEVEASMSGMSIKVTFDTQKKMRHIEFSESSDVLDSTTDRKQIERKSVGNQSFKSNESPSIGSHIRQDPALVSPPFTNKRQVVRLPKGNDESDNVSWSEGFVAGDSSNFAISSIGREGKGAQSDNVQQFSLSSHKEYSAPLHFHNGASHSSEDTRTSEVHTNGAKMPSSLLRGFNMSSSQNPSSIKKGKSFEQMYNNTLQSMETLHLSMDVQSAMQSLQSNALGSHSDSRGKQKIAGSGSGGKKRRELYSKMKESRSKAKDFELPLGSPSFQISGETKVQAQGLSIYLEGNTEHQIMKNSMSDILGKSPTPGLQPQLSSLPSKDNLFYSPMLGKWGDIVDDLPDSYDSPKMKGEGEKEDSLTRQLQNAAGFVTKTGVSADKQLPREASGSKGPRVQDGIFQQNRPSPFQVAQDSPSHIRKSVWERLGPQNDKGSILGPPPKLLDSRIVHKPSPEVYKINTSSSVHGGLDAGFHGMPKTSYHDVGSIPNEEGLEAVLQAYTGIKQKRSKRELYVPRRGV